MKFYLSCLFLFCSFFSFAQVKTLSGYVSDANGEPIVGATVFIPKEKKGVTTNSYGFYSLSLTNEINEIEYSFVGFEKRILTLNVLKDTILNIRLTSISLAEIEIKDKRSIVNDKISTISLPLEQIKNIPAIGGEVDILKALSLTPGVSSGTEGSSGLFVRGGTPDQNLILLDDAVVYNPNHLFGFISVFNPDAIKNVELIKGGFPARYGGRLSSVVDINMKEGSLEKKKTDLGFGLLSSRFTIERPLIKDKLGIMVSARSSYLTLVLLPTWILYQRSDNAQYINYWMYDVNIKLNYKINKTNQIICSLYSGNDFFRTFDKSYNYDESKSKINWGNTTATIRHNKELSPKLFWKNILLFSKFQYNFNAFDKKVLEKVNYEYDNLSGLNDITLRTSIDYIPNNKNYFKAGLEGTTFNFVPQFKKFTTNDSLLEGFSNKSVFKAKATAFFVEDEILLSDIFKANVGFRTTSYNLAHKSYWSYEPRLSIILNIKEWHLKAAYSKMQQNIHLLTNSGIGFQNDIWVPSTDKVKPQQSEQWALGLSKYWSLLDLDMSLEAYYKKMSNLIDYKEGSNILKSADDWYKSVEVNGIGTSKGIELFLHKKTGRLNGFLSYTLAKTDRQFSNINFGEKYAFRYDSRHNFNITSNFKINLA